MHLLLTKKIKEVNEFYKRYDIHPFPYEDIRILLDDFDDEFSKYASNLIITADLNTYWTFIAGLASGTIETKLKDALERFKTKSWLEKTFFEWFPKYNFLERYDLTIYPNLGRDFAMHETMRFMLLEVIKLYEQEELGV